MSIVNALKNTKGKFRMVRISSSVPTLAAHREKSVTKVTEVLVCAGIEFENRKDIKEAIESGERGEVQPLPWGIWAEYPFLIAYKGETYVRLYLPSQAQREAGFAKSSTKFFVDGTEISRDEAIILCGSKAKAKENESGCMSVRESNLQLL